MIFIEMEVVILLSYNIDFYLFIDFVNSNVKCDLILCKHSTNI